MDNKGIAINAYKFALLYALISMTSLIYVLFIPIYLKNIGYSQGAIGFLLAVSPFVALAAQPVWGILGDRVKNKNIILVILVIGSAAAMALTMLSDNFYYVVFIMCAFSFFQVSIFPMSDAIALEYVAKTGLKFGPIRVAGSIGAAVMAVTAGFMSRQNISAIFILYCIVSVLTVVLVFVLPQVEGHQTKRNRISVLSLFRYKQLMIFMAFAFVIATTAGFNGSFFPIYFSQMGGDNLLLGWASFMMLISEMPFIIFSDKILGKYKASNLLIFSAFMLSVRWILLYIVSNPYIILFVQLVHGISYIIFTITLTIYVSRVVPDELKASGQALNGIVVTGISRITGSMAGGYLSEVAGIRPLYLYCCIIVIIVTLITAVFLFYKNKDISCEVFENENA